MEILKFLASVFLSLCIIIGSMFAMAFFIAVTFVIKFVIVVLIVAGFIYYNSKIKKS